MCSPTAARFQNDFDLAASEIPAEEHGKAVRPTTLRDRDMAHDDKGRGHSIADKVAGLDDPWWLGRRHAVIKERIYFAVFRDAAQMQQDAARNPKHVFLFSEEPHQYTPYCRAPSPPPRTHFPLHSLPPGTRP